MNLQRLILLILSVPLFAGADSRQARFEMERPLAGNFQKGQRVRVRVADDVFGLARSFPNDVRIFDTEGTQWPFFLYVPTDSIVTRSIGLDVLNKAWIADPEPCLQFDVSIPDVGGKTPVHNQIELITSGNEFVRRVEIYAGSGATGRMATGYLIEFSGRRDARNQVIRYPDSDMDRLRIRIYPNAQSADETFGIAGVYLRHRSETKAEREPVTFTQLDVGSLEQKDEAQTYLLDTGNANRPVEFIHFIVGDSSYTRCVSVYGRNDEHEQWRRVGGGEIHALPDDRDDTIEVHALHRFLKVQLYHYDDQPLDLAAIQLEAHPRYLVFEAASAGDASLCFRGWDVAAPRYDLKSRMDKTALDTLTVVETQDTRVNAMARAQPWRKYSRLLAGVAIGAVSLLVIWIIVGMLRQPPTGDEG